MNITTEDVRRILKERRTKAVEAYEANADMYNFGKCAESFDTMKAFGFSDSDLFTEHVEIITHDNN